MAFASSPLTRWDRFDLSSTQGGFRSPVAFCRWFGYPNIDSPAFRSPIMNPVNRREFVGDVSRGMLIAGLGTAAAAELGLDSAWAGEEKPIRFGADEALVALLQETTPDKILPAVV